MIVKKKTQNNPSSGGGSNDSGAGDENTDDSGNSSPDTGNTGNDGAGTGTSEEQGNGTEEGKGDTTGEGDDSQSDENVQNQEDSSGAENGTESEEADKQKESSDNDQKKTLSSLADKTLGAQDDKKDRENKDNQVSGNSLSENEESEAADDNLEIEDMIVKADEAMASANGTENGSRLKVLQEDAANVVTIAASTALLISVIGLLLFLLLMGIRVYTEDENGRYKLLGMRICRHQEDSYWLILPCSMTEKSETGRYRLCPGIVFAAMNRDEEMLVESKEDQCKVSVKISKKMDFRL